MLSYFAISGLVRIDSEFLEPQMFNQVWGMEIHQDWIQRSKAKTEQSDFQRDF